MDLAGYLDIIVNFSSYKEKLTPSCEWNMYHEEWRDLNQVVKYFWSRVISVAMAAPDLRHCARYDTHIMRVLEGEMHGAKGNGNTENCIHVIGWLLYFCMYACWRPIHMHMQIPTIVYIWSKTSADPRFPREGGACRPILNILPENCIKLRKKNGPRGGGVPP